MKIIERTIQVMSRKDEFSLYVLGDVHIGALNCAEPELRRLVKRIEKDPNALWVGGGDYCDAVILGDIKRFDVNTLPNWMLVGDAETVRVRIRDILNAQRKRFLNIIEPIRDKCLGLVEGNHEYSILKYHNRNHMESMCKSLDVPELTDCCFIRLRFQRTYSKSKQKYAKPPSRTVTVFVCHGHGGGRTSGSEPNRLYRLAADKEVDIVLTGHSHSFHIHPPITVLTIPRRGALPDEAQVAEKHAANWGSFCFTYQDGPSTYASRANYPIRPMYTVKTTIIPHRDGSNTTKKVKHKVARPVITQTEIKL